MSADPLSPPAARQYTVRAYNQRMAKRVARRAHVDGEGAVAVAFTFNNLATSITLGALVDIVKFIPVIGSYVDLAVSVLVSIFTGSCWSRTRTFMCSATGRSIFPASC
jgi:hypothetical protein